MVYFTYLRNYKNDKKQTKAKLTQTILLEIAADMFDGAGEIWSNLTKPAGARRLICRQELGSREWEAINNEARRKRAVADLRKKKWIRDQRQGNKVIIELNSNALVTVLKQQIETKDKKLPEGQQCLVMFDFPYGANSARSQWRHVLKSADFRLVQLSVWGTDRDVARELGMLIKLLKVEKWVKIYVGHEVLPT